MSIFFTSHNLFAVVILTLAAVGLLVCSVRLAKSIGAGIAVAACVLAALPAVVASDAHSMPVTLICALAAFACLLSARSDLEHEEHAVESNALMLLGAAGGIVLATTTNLLSMLLGLETLSLAVAVLTALGRGPRALEAAFKFFLLGAISVATMIYGVALCAIATGSLDLAAMASTSSLLPGSLERGLYHTGLVLIGVGLAFELAILPVQFGALGVYKTAPTAVAGFAMTTSKLAAGLALLKVANAPGGETLRPILAWLGTLSIVWATFAALAQTELRALLAYSAVSHAGFLALSISLGEAGLQASVFYAVTYVLAGALVFACIAGRSGGVPLASLRTQPLDRVRSVGLALGLLSLAGVPPSPGFWAKLGVLVPAYHGAGAWCAILATLGGVLGALYYLRPVPDLLAGARAPSVGQARPRVIVAVLTGAVLLLTALPFLATRWAAMSLR